MFPLDVVGALSDIIFDPKNHVMLITEFHLKVVYRQLVRELGTMFQALAQDESEILGVDGGTQ